jgi:hypothetical protein
LQIETRATTTVERGFRLRTDAYKTPLTTGERSFGEGAFHARQSFTQKRRKTRYEDCLS